MSSYVRVSIKIKKYNPRPPLKILSKDDDVLFAGLDRMPMHRCHWRMIAHPPPDVDLGCYLGVIFGVAFCCSHGQAIESAVVN